MLYSMLICLFTAASHSEAYILRAKDSEGWELSIWSSSPDFVVTSETPSKASRVRPVIASCLFRAPGSTTDSCLGDHKPRPPDSGLFPAAAAHLTLLALDSHFFVLTLTPNMTMVTETLLLVRSFARFASLRLSVVDSAVDAIL